MAKIMILLLLLLALRGYILFMPDDTQDFMTSSNLLAKNFANFSSLTNASVSADIEVQHKHIRHWLLGMGMMIFRRFQLECAFSSLDATRTFHK